MILTSELPIIDRSVSLKDVGDFSNRLNAMMRELREQMLAPRPRKKAPSFSSSQVAALCNMERTRLNYLASKGGSTLPSGELQGSGRSRTFSLAETRKWIGAESGIIHRPADTPGKIIIVANFKGGSTKTTTAMSMAQGLTLRGRRVLVVDLDPQASLTELCGLYVEQDVQEENTVMPLIYGEESDVRYAVQSTYWDGLDIVPAAPILFSAEFFIPSQVTEKRAKGQQFEFWDILNKGLQPLCLDYDYIIMDTAPSLSYLTINALMAANSMVMPLVPESLDFISSVQFWSLFSELASSFTGLAPAKRFDSISVLLSKVDYSASSSSHVVRSWAQRAYTDWLLPIEIPASSVASSEALEFATVYDIERWDGSLKTLQRIRDPFDLFCELIDNQFVAKWSQP